MTIPQIVSTLHARIINRSSTYDSQLAMSVIVSDLMSDVLVMDKPSPVLLTTLSTEQVIRTASMIDAMGVIIAQDKPLPDGMLDLAKELDITLLHTHLPKFESCVLLGKLLESEGVRFEI